MGHERKIRQKTKVSWEFPHCSKKRDFERSEANRSLRYTSYYGDGDSKAFKNVKDIYGYDSVVKYECIGHVQKRVGSRLRKLKNVQKA
ncbi:uncharacterized protein TNCV_621811 [Trichonephila clavipes]|nr:uncharacterized protein TNCV_621811 [Trichonephila clavipes]